MKVKDWLNNCLAFLLTQDWDTTPERIKRNRIKMTEMVLDSGLLNPDEVTIKVLEFKDLWNEYYHYFDSGYKSKYNIDELPDKLIKLVHELLGEME